MDAALQVKRISSETDNPQLFTNVRPLWRPSGARAIYGGAIAAQCLAAAQQTTPEDFSVHSMHCHFILGADATKQIIHSVDRIRTGRSFITSTVQAIQNDAPIFMTTISFVSEQSQDQKALEFAHKMRDDVPQIPCMEGIEGSESSTGGPFLSHEYHRSDESLPPYERQKLLWLKPRQPLSEQGGSKAHCAALAYMSDAYFITAVYQLCHLDTNSAGHLDSSVATRHYEVEQALDPNIQRSNIGMVVTLSHTVYFHNARRINANDWIYAEMQPSWAGNSRGLVFQKMYSREGLLLATCVQEVSALSTSTYGFTH